jgi:aspartate-semialdehyde dehydrogenase
MSSGELIIDQAGATGVVNELFRQALADPHLRMRLGQVATARKENIGDRLGDHDENCPEEWADKRLISLENLARGGDGGVVFSGLQTDPAGEYEDSLARGRLVVTNASANRTRPDVPVVNAFVNGNHIDELYQRDISSRIIAGGNGMSSILAVPLSPLHRAIGIRGMVVETLQGWSDAGKKEVPTDVDDISLIPGDERNKIRTEPRTFLGESINKAADISIAATPNHGPWLRGHHAKVTATLAREASKHEIEGLWRHFKAPDVLEAVKSELKALSQVEGQNWPRKHQPINPVRLRHEQLVRYDTVPIQLTRLHPMRVKAHIREDESSSPDRIIFEVAGDNLMLGAVGVNLLNVIYARAQGYLE